VPDPVSVELVDVVAVEDETVAGQPGCGGLVVWVEDDLGFLVVQPPPNKRKPGFVDSLFGAEQQPVPVRGIRLPLGSGEPFPFSRAGDQLQHAVGKRRIRFSVDPDSRNPGKASGAGLFQP